MAAVDALDCCLVMLYVARNVIATHLADVEVLPRSPFPAGPMRLLDLLDGCLEDAEQAGVQEVLSHLREGLSGEVSE
jgi:hypothetical protein